MHVDRSFFGTLTASASMVGGTTMISVEIQCLRLHTFETMYIVAAVPALRYNTNSRRRRETILSPEHCCAGANSGYVINLGRFELVTFWECGGAFCVDGRCTTDFAFARASFCFCARLSTFLPLPSSPMNNSALCDNSSRE